jgi:hypothetical protein
LTRTPAVLRQVIAALIAARPEATPCWDAGTPTLRVQRARAAALLRVASKASVVERESSDAETWWMADWQPPASPCDRTAVEVYDWFVRDLRRELHEGPSRSAVQPVSDTKPIPDEKPDAARVPRKRLAKMPEKAATRGRGLDRKRRRR